MSERYSKLFSLPENLYSVGAPVVIAAGALLKDNQTGKVLAQIKIQNIGAKTIKAAKISVCPLDTIGNPLGNDIVHQYLDLDAERDADFGAKSPVILPNAATRSFSVSVLEVAFVDNSVWKASNAPWESLPAPVSLFDAMKDRELVKQYCLQYGNMSRFCPHGEKDVWRCTCGALNHNTENTCHKCRTELKDLLAFDMKALKAARDVRIAKERKQAEADRAAAEASAKKSKKIAIISVSIIAVIIAFVAVLTTVIIPTGKYNDAVSLMESGNYPEAIAAFEALGNYKDSKEKINECEQGITDGEYNNAVSLMESGKYEEAIAAFEALDGYKDSATHIANCHTAIMDIKYDNAIAMMEAGESEDAISAFLALDGYKDSNEKAVSIYQNSKSEELNSATIGDCVFFGSYEQDNDSSNGKEDIEWIVLDKSGSKILLISKYALDCQLYHTSKDDITWENCSLRQWLNNDFTNEAFSFMEQTLIATMRVSADNNPEFDTTPGNETHDEVFLLSSYEAERYFSSSSERICYPTDYAIECGATKRGINFNNGSVSCSWWLRTPGTVSWFASYVLGDGEIDNKGISTKPGDGRYVDRGSIAVRPALWIDLDY